MRLLVLCLCLAATVAFEPAPVFQYRVQTIAGAKPGYAYLWLPAARSHIRGLLICPTTDAEFSLVRHDAIRDACAEAELGIVWFFGGMGSFSDGSDALPTATVGALPAAADADRRQVVDLALAALADQSGYAEVAHAPWFVFGHSTGALFARNMAYWRPERTMGVAYFKAGTFLRSPGAGWEATVSSNQRAVVDRLQGVPVWGINGEYEEFGPGPYADVPGARPKEDGTAWTSAADMLRQELLQLRQAGSPAGQLIDPGAGHHALNEAVIDCLAALLVDLTDVRLPEGVYPVDRPPDLLPVDPTAGYLADSQVETPGHATASATAYDGDPATAWWWPDAASAEAADHLHADLRAGAHHFLDFTTPAGDGWAGTSDPDDPNGIGFAFQSGTVVEHPDLGSGYMRLQARYRQDAPPLHFNIDQLAADNRTWGFSDAPFQFRTNTYAAWELFEADTYDSGSGFRSASFEARRDGWGVGWQQLPGATRKIHAVAPQTTLDGTVYRKSERTIEFKKYVPTGSAQHLLGSEASDPQVFPLADRTADATDEALTTTFSSGLQTIHYVAFGPARVVRDESGQEFLQLAEIPTGATYPIAVRVIAYQWGEAGAYAPAEAVGESSSDTGVFLITGPGQPADGRYCSLRYASSGGGLTTRLNAQQDGIEVYRREAIDHRLGPVDARLDLLIVAEDELALQSDG